MRRAFPYTGRLDLRLTLKDLGLWGGTSWMRVDSDGAWYARRTPDGPGTVRIWQESEAVVAEAWGPGAAAVLDRVPDLCGLHDDPSTWTPTHPILAELKRRRPGWRIGRTGHVYPRLVSTVLGQLVTGKAGKQSLNRVARAWGEPAPGPDVGLWLLPVPKVLAAQPYYAFHRMGIERMRADRVRRVASRASALERAVRMSAPDAMAHLQKLPGIGPWTAGVVAALALGDPDAVPVGDYNLPSVVSWTLANEPRADDVRMLELLAPEAGNRGRAVRLIKTGGRGKVKFGPKVDVPDFRGM
ncbi:MAG: 3-methyladenine DNA glycosylase/8-oxoguanine DNA glycosylase [Myxococcota bacterium]|jgi:3-methyladenine DNA glycosylase/8-oxoguanine DNA glycosylase